MQALRIVTPVPVRFRPVLCYTGAVDLREKRKHHRIELEYPVSVAVAGRVLPAELKDLSKGGAKVAFAFEGDFDDEGVELQLRIPDGLSISVACVIRRKTAMDGRIELGLEFRTADAALRVQLSTLMQFFLSGEHAGDGDHPRVAKRLPIGFKNLSDLESTLENISMGGVALTVERELPLYEEVELSIPNVDGAELLVVKGQVVHQYPVENTDYFRVGVEFKELPAASKRCLQALMYEILELGVA